MRKVEQRFRVRHRPKGSTKIRSTNHSNRPENGEAKDRQQARYRLQIGIEAQIGAEQKRSKAIERHRKETPQRALSQQRLKSLGAKTGNRQSPTTRIAVPDTRQRGTPNPHQGQKAEPTPRDKAAPAIDTSLQGQGDYGNLNRRKSPKGNNREQNKRSKRGNSRSVRKISVKPLEGKLFQWRVMAFCQNSNEENLRSLKGILS